MLWQEDEQEQQVVNNNEVVDISFDIQCRMLPFDHAYALSQAISQVLPWFGNEDKVGLHLIHGASSGNGWERPENETHFYLSRRTKLTLRLPNSRLNEAEALIGQTLQVGEQALTIKAKAGVKPLIQSEVLLARHIIADPDQSEEDFLHNTINEINAMGVTCRKALCGKSHSFTTPDKALFTRSLMVADLALSDSIILQEKGIGKTQSMGFGLFIPHKDIKAVKKENKKSAIT